MISKMDLLQGRVSRVPGVWSFIVTFSLFSTFNVSMQTAADSTNESSPIGVQHGHLVFTNLITSRPGFTSVDDAGLLTILLPDVQTKQYRYATFSMDVGFNKGQTSLAWVANGKLPHMFIIGVEANQLLVSKFEHTPPFHELRQRGFVVPGAVSTSSSGVVTFNTGIGEPNSNATDTGSLFGWTDPKRERVRAMHPEKQQTVRFIRLSDILSHVPPPDPTKFLWDTLKIDIQGADVDGLISAGDFVLKFL
jgi:hypothetical protein